MGARTSGGGKAGGASGPGDDPDLVARYRRGDGEALGELLGDVEEEVLRAARRGLPRSILRRVSVSDILQETRLTAYEQREQFEFRGPGSFKRWILGIAGNKILQAVRHHLGTGKRDARREAKGSSRPSSGAFPSPGASPSQVAAGAELESLARRALAALAPEEREVFRLAREEGLNMTEIGNRLQIPPRTAKRLFGRALVRFREALGGRG